MRTYPYQEAFNAGEFGKRMESRVTFEKYRNAARIMENVLPLPQGGWARRPGFRYIAGATSNSVRPWLIPFEFSTTQAYMLELGEGSMRFYRNQGQIVAANVTAAAITNGTFAANITGWTDKDTGGTAASTWNAAGYAQLLGDGTNYAWLQQTVTGVTNGEVISLKFEIKGQPGDTVKLRVGTTDGGTEIVNDREFEVGYHVYSFTASATTIYIGFRSNLARALGFDNVSILDDEPIEIATPYAESDLPDLAYAQSADVVYFAVGDNLRPYRLDRFAHNSWSFVPVLFEDGPYETQNSTSTTLGLSATSGVAVTVTASATTGINDGAGFRATDVGRLIRFKSTDWTWMQIVGFTDSTHVTAHIKGPAAAATTAVTTWRLGSWNDTDGWPSVVGFIQQRLCLANTNDAPQKFWLSKSAEIESFAPSIAAGTVQDDSSIDYAFAALKVNSIRWVAMRKKPIIGTVGGTWTLRSDGAILTPTDIAADFEVSTGCGRFPPVEARNRLLYVTTSKRKLVEFADVISETGVQGFDSFDLTVLNDRITQGGLVQVAYAMEPDSVIWTCRADGQAPTLTYQPDQAVLGWSRQIAGGRYQGGNAVIESIACIPGTDGDGQWKDSTGRTEVWAAIKRTINGATVRYIEMLEKQHDGEEDIQAEAFHVDSGSTVDSPVTITAMSNASPVVVTYSGTDPANGDRIRINRVVGFEEDTGELDADDEAIFESKVNGYAFKVANVDTGANTFELTDLDDNDIDGTDWSDYESGGEFRVMTNTISAPHLAGETIKIFGDGAWQTDKTLDGSGNATLDDYAGLIVYGLPYTHRYKSLKMATQTQQGITVGKNKSITEATLALMETAEGAIRVQVENDDGLSPYAELDTIEAHTDLAPPFFDGEYKFEPENAYSSDPRLWITGSIGPATVTALAPEVDIEPQV